MKNSRTNFSIKNAYIGIVGQILTYVFTFIFRTIFIHTLGDKYLGVQGVFSNILSLLSLTELGIGSAITFSLYKPLAEKDLRKVKALMDFYAKTYKRIGLLIALFGLILSPFLSFFIKDISEIDNISLIYLLYLGDTVISYFWSYKRSIIEADQKGYISTIQLNLFVIFRTFIQIYILIVFKQFILVLLVQFLSTFLTNISISLKANKMYPYLIDPVKLKLDKETHLDIIKKIKAMFLHQLGSVVVLGTDNLLLSKFVNLAAVGLYSNYLLIIGIIRSLISQFNRAVIASIGNLVSTESVSLTKKIFDIYGFFNFWIYSFSTVCLITLFNPFISLWIGNKYIFNYEIVCVMIINYYISGMRTTTVTFKNVLGLFYNDRYKPVFESVINLVASVILLRYFGILGVFLGTLISTVTTSLWVEPYILFKHYFKTGLFEYWTKYIYYAFVTIAISFIMKLISDYINSESLNSFIILFLICLTLPNLLLFIFFSRSMEFKLLKHKIFDILLRRT